MHIFLALDDLTPSPKSRSRNQRNRPNPRNSRGFCRFGLPQRQNTRKFARKFNVMAVRRIRVRKHADLGDQPPQRLGLAVECAING